MKMADCSPTVMEKSFPIIAVSTAASVQLLGKKVMPPLNWKRVGRFSADIDESMIPTLSAPDFRNLLPGLLLCCVQQERDFESYIFGDLIAYTKSEYWNERFIQRWCQLSIRQLEIISAFLETQCEGLTDSDRVRAIENIKNVQIYIQLRDHA